ncbi:MAG: PKD domain-containing protein [Ferruginibacter sp.]
MKKALPLIIFTFFLFPLLSGAQCVANFSYSNTTCINGTVSFVDMSTATGSAGIITKEIWSWGDGKTDTVTAIGQPVTHDYFNNLVYTVSLTIITSNSCSSTATKAFAVKIKPQVSYIISPIITYCEFDSVMFYNQSAISTGEPLSILWRFYDDGSTGIKNVQNHRFYNEGVYWTSLTVTAQNGCVDSLRKTIATMRPTTTSFTKPLLVCANDSAAFIETSYKASPSSFYSKTWYFGDGSLYIDNDLSNKTIKHKYAAPGKYAVRLRYETSNCLTSFTDSIEVQPSPAPSFFANEGTGGLCGVQQFNFTNLSTAPGAVPLTYQWLFDNSVSSTVENPAYTFTTNGVHAVKLRAAIPSGCAVTLDSGIIVSNIAPKPDANFGYETDPVNLLTFNFYDSSTVQQPVSIIASAWSFGDGGESSVISPSHTYAGKGVYEVKNIVTAANGCTDTITKIIKADSTAIALCNASFSTVNNVCLGNATTFTDYSLTSNGTDSVIKQIWKWGDGSADSVYTGNFFTTHRYIYAAPGTYTSSLTVFTKRGCITTSSLNTSVRSLKAKGDFTYNQVPDCGRSNFTIHFTATTQNYTGNISTKWMYGDGNIETGSGTSAILNHDYYYSTPGNYTVKFLSRISGCSSEYDTTVKIIQVLDRTKSGMMYNIDETNSKTVHFTDKSIPGFNNASGWLWDFGDGTTSADANPVHTYPLFGTYTVKHSFISQVAECAVDTVSAVIHIDSFVTVSANSSQSSMGKDFWAGFGYIENMRRSASNSNAPAMSLYLAAGENPATVTVDIPAMPLSKKIQTGFPKVVYVPADSVVEVTGFPLGDPNDAYNVNDFPDSRLYFTGVTNRGIHITSNQPIGAWEHVYSINNTAGGTLLLPTNVWGNKYYVVARGGKSNNGFPNSFFFVIAETDSTEIQFTPSADIIDSSAATLFTDGHTAANVLYSANVTYTKMLNRGEVFNAMGFIAGSGTLVANSVDLSGTVVTSTNPLKRIAVFGGNGRVLINTTACTTNTAGSDNLIQQIFPKVVWGTKYLTTPTKTMEYGIYRITVEDPTTAVKINGGSIGAPLINGRYYELQTNSPMAIESDKRIMVTQFVVTPGCPGIAAGNNPYGDPEMINLSPLKYAGNNITVYSPNFKTVAGGLSGSYINVVIRKEAITSFQLDHSNMVDTGSSSFVIPPHGSSGLIPVQNAFKPHPGDANYYYAKIKVATGATHTLQADSLFTAIAYGIGNGESIGYNVGFNFNASQIKYQYLGTGNWTDAINWLGNKIPPNPLPMGAEVTITGRCILNVPQTVEDGARIIVEAGASLIINGNLLIQQ